MNVAVKVVNFILARGLNHRQFRELLTEVDAEHNDLVYYCEVRWLSRGRMLERLYDLRGEVAAFLSMKGANFPEFSDPNWLLGLAFLADLTSHLNDLNVRLQGKDLLIPDMISSISAFEVKLRLWESQLREGDFTHFQSLRA